MVHVQGIERPVTERQTEILALLAEGLTNREIAERLVLSTGTVANHVGHLLVRLGLQNRVQLAVWYTRHSLSNAACVGEGARQATGLGV